MGGNATIQLFKRAVTVNDIGEHVETWVPVWTACGYLDYVSGETDIDRKAKLEDVSHVFICAYEPILSAVSADNARAVVQGTDYAVKLIDNPMGLCRQWEIYLKKVD